MLYVLQSHIFSFLYSHFRPLYNAHPPSLHLSLTCASLSHSVTTPPSLSIPTSPTIPAFLGSNPAIIGAKPAVHGSIIAVPGFNPAYTSDPFLLFPGFNPAYSALSLPSTPAPVLPFPGSILPSSASILPFLVHLPLHSLLISCYILITC